MDLYFHEDGKDYKEKIIFDDASNTTFIHVPKHGKIPQHVDYLIDHNLVCLFIVSRSNLCSNIKQM